MNAAIASSTAGPRHLCNTPRTRIRRPVRSSASRPSGASVCTVISCHNAIGHRHGKAAPRQRFVKSMKVVRARTPTLSTRPPPGRIPRYGRAGLGSSRGIDRRLAGSRHRTAPVPACLAHRSPSGRDRTGPVGPRDRCGRSRDVRACVRYCRCPVRPGVWGGGTGRRPQRSGAPSTRRRIAACSARIISSASSGRTMAISAICASRAVIEVQHAIRSDPGDARRQWLEAADRRSGARHDEHQHTASKAACPDPAAGLAGGDPDPGSATTLIPGHRASQHHAGRSGRSCRRGPPCRFPAEVRAGCRRGAVPVRPRGPPTRSDARACPACRRAPRSASLMRIRMMSLPRSVWMRR